MARQSSYITIDGTLGGLTFYRADGQELIRSRGGISKERILKEPNFKRTRENMREFGGSAKVGKALRLGYMSILKSMSDATMVGRLTGLMKRVNLRGPGARGERTFEILPNAELIKGFEFNKETQLQGVFYAPYAAPSLDANRSIATWVVPDFNTDTFITPPEGATHFALLLVSTVLSDYKYSVDVLGYEPAEPAENEVNGIAFSAAIPLGGMVGADTTLSVDLGFSSVLPATVGVVVAVGIEFYQEVNGTLYTFASDNAMRIVLVG